MSVFRREDLNGHPNKMGRLLPSDMCEKTELLCVVDTNSEDMNRHTR